MLNMALCLFSSKRAMIFLIGVPVILEELYIHPIYLFYESLRVAMVTHQGIMFCKYSIQSHSL